MVGDETHKRLCTTEYALVADTAVAPPSADDDPRVFRTTVRLTIVSADLGLCARPDLMLWKALCQVALRVV